MGAGLTSLTVWKLEQEVCRKVLQWFCSGSHLAEERLQLGQSDDGGLNQNLAVVVVWTLQAALQTLRGEDRADLGRCASDLNWMCLKSGCWFTRGRPTVIKGLGWFSSTLKGRSNPLTYFTSKKP